MGRLHITSCELLKHPLFKNTINRTHFKKSVIYSKRLGFLRYILSITSVSLCSKQVWLNKTLFFVKHVTRKPPCYMCNRCKICLKGDNRRLPLLSPHTSCRSITYLRPSLLHWFKICFYLFFVLLNLQSKTAMMTSMNEGNYHD